MARYFLSKEVFVCQAAGYTVFLNLATDRYLALPPEAGGLLHQLFGEPTPERTAEEDALGELATELESERVVVSDEKHGKLFEQVRVPAVEDSIRVYGSPRSEVPFRHRLRFRLAKLYAAVQLRFLSLEATVRRVRARKHRRMSTAGVTDRFEANRLASIFLSLQPQNFEGEDACLRNSLVLIEFLAQFEIYPDWVFGIRLPPFAAHSWVQQGATVLNDSVRHVETFTPVMVV